MNDLAAAFTLGKINAICDLMRGARRWTMRVGDVQRPEVYVWQQRKSGWTYRLRFEGSLIVLERTRPTGTTKDPKWETYRRAAIKDVRLTPKGLLMPTWSVEL